MRVTSILLALAVAAPGAGAAEAPADGSGVRPTAVRVREATGAPVGGAAVRFLLPGPKGLEVTGECRTGPDGACSLALERGEAVWLEVEMEGFTVSRRGGLKLGQPNVVTLDRPALIEGKVVDQDGRPFGPLELLLIDMTVLKGDERIPLMRPLVPVGEDGRFRVTKLASGEYTLSPIASQAAPASLAEPVPPIRIASGKGVSGVIVRVVRHGALAGRIVFTEGVPDDIKVTPVPRAEPGGNAPRFDKGYADAMQRSCERETTLECVYKLEDLVPGLYDVEVEGKGIGPFLAPLPEKVLPGTVTKVADLWAPSPVRLSGTVRDREKKPVGGALMTVYFPDIPLAVLDATSDESGTLGPLLVSPGTYRIEVSHPDFVIREDRFSVTGALKSHDLLVSLDPGNRLEGVYVSTSRRPKEGVEISAEREGGGGLRETRTDAAGRFAFGGLTSGKYLVVALDGLDSAFKQVEISRAPPSPIVIDAIRDRPPIEPPLPPQDSTD